MSVIFDFILILSVFYVSQYTQDYLMNKLQQTQTTLMTATEASVFANLFYT